LTAATPHHHSCARHQRAQHQPGETRYPGDPGVEVGVVPRNLARRRGQRHGAQLRRAHGDARRRARALHRGRAGTSDFIPLEAFVGEARVVEIPADALAVEERHVTDETIKGATRVLFKTRNSAFWDDPRGRFREDFTYIEPGAARALVSRGVRLVGFDYLSVEKFGSEGFETHLALLSAASSSSRG
jgi:hypothetical protein